jgi:hypothetical protein
MQLIHEKPFIYFANERVREPVCTAGGPRNVCKGTCAHAVCQRMCACVAGPVRWPGNKAPEWFIDCTPCLNGPHLGPIAAQASRKVSVKATSPLLLATGLRRMFCADSASPLGSRPAPNRGRPPQHTCSPSPCNHTGVSLERESDCTAQKQQYDPCGNSSEAATWPLGQLARPSNQGRHHPAAHLPHGF